MSGFPSTGLYDDHVLDRLRLSPAGVGVVFSHAYRLRRTDWNGASVEYRLVSRAASALFLLRLAFAIARPVICDIRPVPRIVGRDGRAAGRLCLLTAGGAVCPVSSPSSARSFLTHHIGICSGPVASSCLLRLVRSVYHSACGRGRSSPFLVRRHVGTLLLASSLSCALIAPVPFLVSCCGSFRFSSLFAPSCDTTGGELLCGCRPRLARRLCRCLPCVGRGCRVRMACYYFGSFSSCWCFLWVVCMGRLLAVLVVYLYCELVVYIVRLDFRYG